MMQDLHAELTSNVLIGMETQLTPEGDVHLMLRYGVTMAPREITFRMTARQAGRLAQGLMLALHTAQRPARQAAQ